jgi:hypothetical protein
MEPRIYLYRITFEGRPEWYLGIHKEKKKVSNLWGVSHTQVKRVFKKHWKGEPPYSWKLSTKALLAP